MTATTSVGSGPVVGAVVRVGRQDTVCEALERPSRDAAAACRRASNAQTAYRDPTCSCWQRFRSPRYTVAVTVAVAVTVHGLRSTVSGGCSRAHVRHGRCDARRSTGLLLLTLATGYLVAPFRGGEARPQALAPAPLTSLGTATLQF